MISFDRPLTMIRFPMVESAAPVSMRQHHCFRTFRQNILRVESAPENRMYAKDGECAFRDGQTLDLFRLGEARDARRSTRPHPDVLERMVLFPKRKVERGR